MRTANWSRRQIGLGTAAIWVLVEVSLLWIAPAAIGADEAITLLQTGKAKYKNVLVTDRNGTNIYIRHDGGLANVKIGDLPPDVQQSLGYATPEEDVSSQADEALLDELDEPTLPEGEERRGEVHPAVARRELAVPGLKVCGGEVEGAARAPA